MFITHSVAFTCTQAHSSAFMPNQSAFKHVQYLLKGICTLRVCSNAFSCIQTCSKAFMHTYFHVEISKKWRSVTFRLTQRCSHALIHVQLHSMLIQRHSHTPRVHSRMFNTQSKAFMCIQSAFNCI